MKDSLAREVELKKDDTCYTAIRRVSDTIKITHTMFLRKVRFISLELVPGEWAGQPKQ